MDAGWLAWLLQLLAQLAAWLLGPSGRLAFRAKGNGLSESQPEEPQLTAVAKSSAPAHHVPGVRVQFQGLEKCPNLNGRYGVVVRYEKSTDRYAVRKEVARAEESSSVTVKATNLCAAPQHATLAALQEFLDGVPSGARVTLPRGAILAVSTAGEMLEIKTAITLAGMGNRAGGTEFGFGVCLGADCEGELLELSGVHIRGAVEISPRDLARVKLCKVSVTAPPDAQAAVLLDEIGMMVPRDPTKAAGRALLEECWIRGGRTGVEVSCVGVAFVRCRIMEAQVWGIHALAKFSVEGCRIGDCGKAGAGGGILARGGVALIRKPQGHDENGIQRDAFDKGYLGYLSPDCRGCVSECTCSAMMSLASYLAAPVIMWAKQGKGAWQHRAQM